MKNFLWGILIFVLNIFLIYQNYTKNFTFSMSFFVEVNQMMAFLAGLIYSQQCRKFDLTHVLGIVSNSAIFSFLITIVFAIYGAKTSFQFTILLFVGTFICMFISYGLFYWLFCPEKYKNKYKRKKYEKAIHKNIN